MKAPHKEGPAPGRQRGWVRGPGSWLCPEEVRGGEQSPQAVSPSACPSTTPSKEARSSLTEGSAQVGARTPTPKLRGWSSRSEEPDSRGLHARCPWRHPSLPARPRARRRHHSPFRPPAVRAGASPEPLPTLPAQDAGKQRFRQWGRGELLAERQ